METVNHKIIKPKIGLLNLAEELGGGVAKKLD
jgi:hypothetical protein